MSDYERTLDLTETCPKVEAVVSEEGAKEAVNAYQARRMQSHRLYAQEVARRNVEGLRNFYQAMENAIELSPPCGHEARWWMADLIRIRDESLERLGNLNDLLQRMAEDPKYSVTPEDEALI